MLLSCMQSAQEGQRTDRTGEGALQFVQRVPHRADDDPALFPLSVRPSSTAPVRDGGGGLTCLSLAQSPSSRVRRLMRASDIPTRLESREGGAERHDLQSFDRLWKAGRRRRCGDRARRAAQVNGDGGSWRQEARSTFVEGTSEYLRRSANRDVCGRRDGGPLALASAGHGVRRFRES